MDLARREGSPRILRRRIRGWDARVTRVAVVLRQHLAQEFGRVEFVLRQIFPEEFTTPNDVPFTHREELQRQPLAFAIIPKDIDVAFRSRRHLLLLGKFDYSLAQISILGSDFVTHLFRSVQHALFQNVGQFRVAALQEHAYVAHCFLIFRGCAQTLDARPETAFDVVFQTRPGRLAVNFDVASAQLKSAIDQVDCLARHRCRQKWPKVKRAVVLNAARNHAFGKGLVDGELQMRVRLVVF